MSEKKIKSENYTKISTREDGAVKPHSLCAGCPYGRNHEICFPCWKFILGQEGYH